MQQYEGTCQTKSTLDQNWMDTLWSFFIYQAHSWTFDKLISFTCILSTIKWVICAIFKLLKIKQIGELWQPTLHPVSLNMFHKLPATWDNIFSCSNFAWKMRHLVAQSLLAAWKIKYWVAQTRKMRHLRWRRSSSDCGTSMSSSNGSFRFCHELKDAAVNSRWNRSLYLEDKSCTWCKATLRFLLFHILPLLWPRPCLPLPPPPPPDRLQKPPV